MTGWRCGRVRAAGRAGGWPPRTTGLTWRESAIWSSPRTYLVDRGPGRLRRGGTVDRQCVLGNPVLRVEPGPVPSRAGVLRVGWLRSDGGHRRSGRDPRRRSDGGGRAPPTEPGRLSSYLGLEGLDRDRHVNEDALGQRASTVSSGNRFGPDALAVAVGMDLPPSSRVASGSAGDTVPELCGDDSTGSLPSRPLSPPFRAPRSSRSLGRLRPRAATVSLRPRHAAAPTPTTCRPHPPRHPRPCRHLRSRRERRE